MAFARMDSLIKSENDRRIVGARFIPPAEVQEKLLPGELGVSPSFSKSPNVWGFRGFGKLIHL
jgi:hypothetical protein